MKVQETINLQVDTSDIRVTPSNILELLGYGNEPAEDHIYDLVNECLIRVNSDIDPRGGVIFLKNEYVDSSKGEVYCGKNVLHTNKIIARQLMHAEYLALFVCTIGSRVEKLSKKMMDAGDFLEGVIFDLIGSEAAEETADLIHQMISSLAGKENLAITNRFSPGYCNWSVQDQFKLFSFFKESAFGITLNSSALMNPLKSVSGIVGVGKNVECRPYSCSACNDEKCIYRNRKSHVLL